MNIHTFMKVFLICRCKTGLGWCINNPIIAIALMIYEIIRVYIVMSQPKRMILHRFVFNVISTATG